MNMEAKRGKMAARRRHRITALRNSSEEEGRMELQKIVRSRERERVFHGDGVGDQDQELLNGRKRRRNEKQLERNKHKDVRSGGVENEGSSGSSNQELNYEDYDYEEPSSSMSNYALRKTVTPIRNVRLISGLEMAAEMISVEVPRRARSASVKRKNEQWTSSPWEFGFGERCQSRRPSPMGGSVSLRKKMKPKGLFSRVPSIQDDIEIEVVEALFDLMKQSQSQLQSQSSKKDERISDHIHTKKLDLIGNKDFHAKSECSPAVSAQIGPAASNLPPGINSELSTENQLKIGKMSSGTLKRMGEIKISLGKGKESNKAVQERITSRSCGQSNGDCSADSTLSKENLASEVVKPKTGVKFETDLMAPPPTPSSPDRHGSNIIVPSLKLDLGKPEQANVISCSYINLKERERNHCVVCDSERQNFGEFSNSSCRTTALQLAPFTLSQPRSKRCMTHQYIASNIHHHRQLTRKYVLPAATGPVSLHETKHCSCNPTTSTPNSFVVNPPQGDLPGTLATPLVLSVTEKSFEVTKTVDATNGKQLVVLPLQTSEQASAGNLLAANVIAEQTGSDNSATTIGKAALSYNPEGGPALCSLSFPVGKVAVSSNCSNLPTEDGFSFMPVFHNNTHPYSMSTNNGILLPAKGSATPVLPFPDASYYPSMFCIPQNQQKQLTCLPHSNPLYQVLKASPTTGTSSGLTTSHKPSKSHLEIMAQAISKSSFSSEELQLQPSQMQHVLGSHSSGKFVDGSGSFAQKASNDENYGIPFQIMKFALASHEDGKQQHLVSEHIGFSFKSTSSIKPEAHISALPQDSASKSTVKEVSVDGLTQTRSSLPTSNTGNQSLSSSSAPISVVSVNSSISQQQRQQKEIIQLQKQHTEQMQLACTVQVQAPMFNNSSYSSGGCNYPNGNSIFSLVHNDNLVQFLQLQNGSVATTPQIPSLATTSSLKNLTPRQSRNSQRQSHISFESNLNSASLFHRQQFLINRRPISSVVDGRSSSSSTSTCIHRSGCLQTSCGDRKGYPAAAESPTQQIKMSTGPSQKPIPVCGRDVPSIVSTRTSQLSELKY